MCDVSDGLLADVGHIAASSGVRIDIESALLEIGEPIASVAAAYGTDPLPWVLAGGHDHALVAAFPAGDDAAGGLHPDRPGAGASDDEGGRCGREAVTGRRWQRSPSTGSRGVDRQVTRHFGGWTDC